MKIEEIRWVYQIDVGACCRQLTGKSAFFHVLLSGVGCRWAVIQILEEAERVLSLGVEGLICNWLRVMQVR